MLKFHSFTEIIYLFLLQSSHQLKADMGQQMKHSNKPSQKTSFLPLLRGSFVAETGLRFNNPPANTSTPRKCHKEAGGKG